MTLSSLSLASLENEEEFQSISQDILTELKKFGKIISYTMPRMRDLNSTPTIKKSALGKIFIEFEEIASAFVAYNLLYERRFLDQTVTIEFFPRD